MRICLSTPFYNSMFVAWALQTPVSDQDGTVLFGGLTTQAFDREIE